MIAKYLIQKWNINEKSGISEDVAFKYFQELEAVNHI